MSRSSYSRFVPSLESLADRLNLSPVVPTETFSTPQPRPELGITVEYLVLGAVPSRSHDNTGPTSFQGHKENAADGVGANETITIGGNQSELPAVQKFSESAARIKP